MFRLLKKWREQFRRDGLGWRKTRRDVVDKSHRAIHANTGSENMLAVSTAASWREKG
jgi:hypothetical protein